MQNFNFLGIFNNNSNSGSKKRGDKQRRGRTCRIEELENREMLSATPWALADNVFLNDGDIALYTPHPSPLPEGEGTQTSIAPLAAATPAEFNDNDFQKLYAAGLIGESGNTLKGEITWSTGASKRLVSLVAYSTELTGSLNLSDCTALETLNVSGNKLEKLDVSGCTALTNLYCVNNNLTELDVFGNTALVMLQCTGNKLEKLDVSDCKALKVLYCGNNNLTELDVFDNTALVMLLCSDNQLTELDVSKNTALTSLYFGDNQLSFSKILLPSKPLSSYDMLLGSQQALVDISLHPYGIVDLSSEYLDGSTTFTWYKRRPYTGDTIITDYTNENGVFTFDNLDEGDVFYCVMTNDRFPQWTFYPYPDSNPHISINIEELQLWTVSVTVGQPPHNEHDWDKVVSQGLEEYATWGKVNRELRLVSLNIPLKSFSGTSIDLSDCTALTTVHCGGDAMNTSPLASLNLSGCTALEDVLCNDSSLTMLNLSGCEALKQVICYGNQLTFSTLPPSGAFKYDYAYNSVGYHVGQAPMPIAPLLNSGGKLDLSVENVNENTTYTWYYAGGTTLAPVTEESPGVFSFAGLNDGDVIYCVMTNTDFPDLTLTTTEAEIFSGTQPLDAPVVVEGAKDATSLAFTWANDINATAYEVWCSINGATAEKWTADTPTLTGATWSISISGLDADTKYEFYVVAVGDGTIFLDSEPSNIVTWGEAPFDPPVIGLTGSVVSWSKVDDAAKYRVEVQRPGETGFESVDTITGLSINLAERWTATGNYVVRVIAIKADNTESEPSNQVTWKIDASAEILTVTGGGNSLIISWTDSLPEGSVLQFKPENSGEWMTWIASYAGTTLTIPGLAEGTYDVRLVDAQGAVSYSKSEVMVASSGTNASKALKPKAKVEKKAAAISSVTVSWSAPKKATAASNTRYVVSYSIKVGKKWTMAEQFSTVDRIHTFTGLNPNTSYRITVTAVNANGEAGTDKKGKVTSAVNITAKTKAYAAPTGISKTVTSNSITLTWKASPFVETTHYEVRDASGTLLATIPATGTTGKVSWTYDDLIPSTTYKFQIFAVSDALGGIKSKVAKVSAKTKK